MNQATNTAEQLPEEDGYLDISTQEVSMLSLVQKPESLAHESIVCKALLDIREMLNKKLQNTGHIFNNVLSQKQRIAILQFSDVCTTKCDEPFFNFTKKERLSIKKTIMNFGKIFQIFNDASALETKKFLKQAELCQTSSYKYPNIQKPETNQRKTYFPETYEDLEEREH